MHTHSHNLTPPSEKKTPAPTVSKIDWKKHFSLIQPELSEIENRIQKQTNDFDPNIAGYIEYALETQGKRIRPSLVLLTAKATGDLTPDHLNLAIIVELIHLATLVHDDIIDGANKRRGQPTACAKWGAEISVLLGDCLFSHALKLCTRFETTEVSRQIAEAASEVCSGEILQTQRRFDLQLSIPDYLKMISMKTAALFRVSTELAALLNPTSPEQQQACRTYGQSLGIAYQIYDDCLDLISSEEQTGKTIGTDLARGKLTLPLLHVLQQPHEKQNLSELLLHRKTIDHRNLLHLIFECGGIHYATRKIQTYLTQASQSLELLPPTPFRHTLQSLAQSLALHVTALKDSQG